MAMFRAASRLKSADFPPFGGPTMATLPALSLASFLSMVVAVAVPRLSQLRVRVAFCGQLPYAITHVDRAGDEGKEARGDDQIEQRKKMHLQHDPRDRGHLQKRRHFPRPAWPPAHSSVQDVEHRTADDDHDVARDHEHGEPDGKLARARIARAPVADAQRDNSAQEQALVRDRI